MAEFYTIDRSQRLKEGMLVGVDDDYTARRFFPVNGAYTKEELLVFLNTLFPSGLASHGKQYLLDECLIIRGSTPTSPQPFAPHMPMIEIVCELVRRLEFSHRPSRFLSLFAFETIDEAQSFRTTHCPSNSPIYRVSADTSFKADMSLLYLGGTILGAWLYATRYWNASSSASPRWEVLLPPPVKILNLVTI